MIKCEKITNDGLQMHNFDKESLSNVRQVKKKEEEEEKTRENMDVNDTKRSRF